jgi:hypothetical protein
MAEGYNRPMRFAVAAVLSAFTVACSTLARPCVAPNVSLSAVPNLGDVVPDPGETCVHTMVAPSQTWPSYETVVAGVPYTLGLDREHRVRFVATNDPAFRTPEGLKMGDPAETVAGAAQGQEVMLERGWGHFVKLPSGWHVLLDNPTPDPGTAALGPDARVTMFFLRE